MASIPLLHGVTKFCLTNKSVIIHDTMIQNTIQYYLFIVELVQLFVQHIAVQNMLINYSLNTRWVILTPLSVGAQLSCTVGKPEDDACQSVNKMVVVLYQMRPQVHCDLVTLWLILKVELYFFLIGYLDVPPCKCICILAAL